MAHWYRQKDGSPAHFEGKDGAGTTLRDARRLLKADEPIVPSVTTVLNITSKPQLTYWLQKEAVFEAYRQFMPDPDDMLIGHITVPILSAEDIEPWAKSVIASAKERTMAKADAGTAIHDALERFMKGEKVEPKHMKMCKAVYACLLENCGEQNWKMEEHFASDLGYGGMCDLHSEEWVVDYKSKDTVDDKTRGWQEQADQLAAYAHGLGVPEARTANIFISRTPPPEGEPWPVKFFEHKDDMAWHRFKAALVLWQVTNKYGRAFEQLIKLTKPTIEIDGTIEDGTIEIDGYRWLLRAGEPYGTYETVRDYMGRASIESTVCFVARHNIKKLKHGKLTIISKPQIDEASGATCMKQAQALKDEK